MEIYQNVARENTIQLVDINGGLQMKFSDENIEKIRKFEKIKNAGYYVNANELADVYNEVLEKRVTPTQCGACCRARISELVNALNQFEKQMQLETNRKQNEEQLPQDETNTKVEKPKKNIRSKKDVVS